MKINKTNSLQTIFSTLFVMCAVAWFHPATIAQTSQITDRLSDSPASPAQSGGSFQIEKSVVAGGGRTSTGGGFTVEGTIGQSAAGTFSNSGANVLVGGFWTSNNVPVVVGVTISGKVTTPTGLGLRNAVVTMIDQLGVRRTATTSSFGLYSFDSVLIGQTYVMTISSKRFRFSPKTVPVNGSLVNVDFFGLE